MASDVFLELSIIIIIATLVTAITRMLKQPLIIGYILTGIISSAYFLNIVKSVQELETFAHLGLALLLFMVGLNLNPKTIKDIGRVSIITGIGQVVFTSLTGFFIAKFLGFSTIASIYISVALTFSSTIIIMKLLSDRNELETLHGKISIGFLIVQDLIAALILMVLPSISIGENIFSLIIITLLKSIVLLAGLFLIGLYTLPKITKFIAKSQEFLLLFSLGWAFVIASIFYYLNFSVEVGALLAGVTLSLTPYRYEISSKMKPIRDFFLILFFVLLGSQIVFVDLNKHLLPIIIFSLFILIGNPIILMVIMGLLGYKKRTSFLSGLITAQISEFSIILIALGVKLGHLSNEILSLVTLVGLITIASSSYMIIYSNKLYNLFSRYLNIFERRETKDEENRYKRENYEIILFGCNRIGYDILESLKKEKNKFLIVDYNPEVIEKLSKEGFDCIYGDASDSELLDELKLSDTKMIISTIPDTEINILLIEKIKKINRNTITIIVSHDIDDTFKLYNEGATYVFMPHFIGGHHVANIIEKYKFDKNKFLKNKAKHIKDLKKRKEMQHEHPRHERD